MTATAVSSATFHEKSLPYQLEEHARRRPDAMFMRTSERVVSYREAHATTRQWASAFRAHGVTAQGTVVVMLPVGMPAVYTWSGLATLRAIEVPINVDYQGRMLDYVIRDSKASLVVVHESLLPRLQAVPEALEGISLIVVVGSDDVPDEVCGVAVSGLEDFLASGDADPVVDVVHAADHEIATIMYTSGTTGLSKGVMVPWAQLQETARWCLPIEDIDETDVYYSSYPLFHIAGKLAVYTTAWRGGGIFLRERFSTDHFWSDIRTYSCTVVILLGAVANFIYRQDERPDDADNPLDKVCMVPTIPEVAQFAERFGVRVCTTFNMTETSIPLSSLGWEIENERTCGRVRPGISARLVDMFDREVPDGEVGELVLRADEPWTLMAGYWGKPDTTAEAWRNQWLHTGDLFKKDGEGNFYFVDRAKDSMRRRGENISSVEVELDVLAYPGVLEAAAIGVPSEWGEDDVMVCVVTKPGAHVDPAELHEFLKERMARFMLPRYLRFIDAMPKTATEKIRKVELRGLGVTDDTWDAEAVGALGRRSREVVS